MSTGVYYWQLDDESLTEVQDILKSHLGLQPDTSTLSDSSETDIVDRTTDKNEFETE